MIRPRDCPICRKPVLPAVEGAPDCFPFCSERCRQVDLLRWSKGQYAIVEPLTEDQLREKAAEELADDEPEEL